MNKRELAVLEKAFEAEINDRLPFQTRSKLAAWLERDGYLQPMTVEYSDNFGAMTVKGWQLTHLGRLTYCATCKEES